MLIAQISCQISAVTVQSMIPLAENHTSEIFYKLCHRSLPESFSVGRCFWKQPHIHLINNYRCLVVGDTVMNKHCQGSCPYRKYAMWCREIIIEQRNFNLECDMCYEGNDPAAAVLVTACLNLILENPLRTEKLLCFRLWDFCHYLHACLSIHDILFVWLAHDISHTRMNAA